MFEIYDKNNKKLNCEVLFTFSKDNKNFIVYNDQDDDVLASYFEINNDKTIIYPITNDADFDIVNEEIEKRLKSYE